MALQHGKTHQHMIPTLPGYRRHYNPSPQNEPRGNGELHHALEGTETRFPTLNLLHWRGRVTETPTRKKTNEMEQAIRPSWYRTTVLRGKIGTCIPSFDEMKQTGWEYITSESINWAQKRKKNGDRIQYFNTRPFSHEIIVFASTLCQAAKSVPCNGWKCFIPILRAANITATAFAQSTMYATWLSTNLLPRPYSLLRLTP